MKYKQTPSQTVGPYFAYGLTPEQYGYDFRSLVTNELVSPLDQQSIRITGRVFDGASLPITDAMIEMWQGDNGQPLFGRCGTGTDPQHRFIFYTVKPSPRSGQAPFLTLIIFMRGQLIHTYTRLYFDDEADLNAQDMVLNQVPAERRSTLIARKIDGGYTLDIYMQGDRETVFFDV